MTEFVASQKEGLRRTLELKGVGLFGNKANDINQKVDLWTIQAASLMNGREEETDRTCRQQPVWTYVQESIYDSANYPGYM